MKKILIVGISSFLLGLLLNHFSGFSSLKGFNARVANYRFDVSEKNGNVKVFRNNKKILSLQEDGQNVVSLSLLNESEIIMSTRILFDKPVSLMGILFTTPVDEHTKEISNYQWIDPSYAGSNDIAGMRKVPKSK
jgi:hypothetical protein